MRWPAVLVLLFGVACARSNPSYLTEDDNADTSHMDVTDASLPSDASGTRPPDAVADGAARPVTGLLGYWRFEDPSGGSRVADSSGNNRHGVLQGLNRDSAWVTGKFGRGLAVTSSIANAGVEVPADPVIDGLRA